MNSQAIAATARVPDLRAEDLSEGGMKFQNDYNADGAEKRREAREAAGNKCIRCGSPSVPGKILTTHHFDGDKANDEWWNLLALCQVCHLKIQCKVDPHVPFMFEHSDWLKPFVAGFYAKKYEGRMITRDEAMRRLEELLAYELLTVTPNGGDGPRGE